MWIPSVLLLDDQMNYFKPSCYATLISEQFLLTMARCKYVTSKVLIYLVIKHQLESIQGWFYIFIVIMFAL